MSAVQKCVLSMHRMKLPIKKLVQNSDKIYVIIEKDDHIEAFKRQGKNVRKLIRFEVARLIRNVNTLLTYIVPVRIERLYHGLIVRYFGYYISYNEERVKMFIYVEYEVVPIHKSVTLIFVKTYKLDKFIRKFFDDG